MYSNLKKLITINNNTLQNKNKNNINHKFLFVSLIQPYTIKYTNNLYLNSTTTDNKLLNTRLYLKQSYMILTWIIYLTGTSSKYFIFPKKMSKLTLVKSPMAHKTFSQEQYKFEFFKLIVPLRSKNPTTKQISSTTSSLHFALKLRSYYTNKSIIGTNLLFLQKHIFRYIFTEKSFFKL